MGRDAESGAGTGERPRPGGPSQSPAAGDRAGTHRAYGAECDGDGAAGRAGGRAGRAGLCRSEEHTSELQSLMRISYAVFCMTKKNVKQNYNKSQQTKPK